jgi:hypothetical protein
MHMPEQLTSRIRRFAPVIITADDSVLPAEEQKALAYLIEAARLTDGLFLEQVWSGNTNVLLRLLADHSPGGQAALRYFLMNKGPWSRLDGNRPFLGPAYGIPEKPPQADFYPSDATREEIETWIDGLTDAERAEATSFYTVVRRRPGQPGGFVPVPYSLAYQNQLAAIGAHLEAAALTRCDSLRRFLELRSRAFHSNDYYESDVAWMELDGPIDITIGPYETYEDQWFGYKAAFEAFVGIRDDESTSRLAAFGSELQGLENALPLRPEYRNPRLGALAPIRVINLIVAAGDGNKGVTTAAFNLPNDDRIIREKGAKRVMLKNVQEAKFEQVLVPIAAAALAPGEARRVSFEAFFTHILMHELMHALGPQQVHAGGRAVRLALKDTYAAIEEAKADISGLWALGRLADQRKAPPAIIDALYLTFLASAFRSLRFGLHEAHGRGIALQLNHLLDRGAVVVDGDGRFGVDEARMRSAVEELTGRLMTIQAEGDYEAARALLQRYVSVRPQVQRVLDRVTHVPVDLSPRYAGA